LRHGKGCIDLGDAFIGTVFVDELDLADADLLVDARPLLGGGLRRSDRATNGCDLLVLLLHRRSAPRFDCRARRMTNPQDREFFDSSQRQ
jgi:hypothetical protein